MNISKFIDFTVKQANDRDFKGCDSTIKKVFKNVGGDNIRVDTDWFTDRKGDVLTLNVVYGSKNDTLFVNADFHKFNGKCYATTLTQLTSNKSCIAYFNQHKHWNFITETADTIIYKNKGGVKMYLTPVGDYCIVNYYNSYMN